MLLRLGRHYPGKKTWDKAHMTWLAGQKLEHLEQRIALEERLVAVRQARERIERLERAIREAVPAWSLAPSGSPGLHRRQRAAASNASAPAPDAAAIPARNKGL